MEIKQEIEKIDNRLTELRKDWVYASPTMKKFINAGAQLLKDKRRMLESKLKNDNQLRLL